MFLVFFLPDTEKLFDKQLLRMELFEPFSGFCSSAEDSELR